MGALWEMSSLIFILCFLLCNLPYFGSKVLLVQSEIKTPFDNKGHICITLLSSLGLLLRIMAAHSLLHCTCTSLAVRQN